MEKVLFVCVENSCRSQMAEGFAKSLARGIFDAYSAGSKPSGKINPMAIEVMKEAGVDISSQISKGFDALDIDKFDVVITLGCGDVCPYVPALEHIAWQIDDPKGKDMEYFRNVRDKIKGKVKSLSEAIADSKN